MIKKKLTASVGTVEARRPETRTGRRELGGFWLRRTELAQRLQASEYVTAQGGRTRLQDPEVWGSRWLQDGMEGTGRNGGKCMTNEKDKLVIWIPRNLSHTFKAKAGG